MRATIVLLLVAIGLHVRPTTAAPPVSYTRDIKPLLANRCYACHGPDESTREANLRLDNRDAAVEWAIVPGDAGSSEVVARISADDADSLMPPADSNKPRLTPAEIEIVRRWIDEGAKFDSHWAYIAPRKPEVPAAVDSAWPRGAIDHFVADRHAEQGLSPSPDADRRTLIRRLSWDLVGMPPTPEEVDAFMNDSSADAYEKQVERLLASPHFGERMAVYWLDIVRYADSGGYHSDNHRDVWLYRDYVIRAFNDNLPLDRMITEQLAGDLLPNATRWQKIASGYNRLLQTTEEGGAQPKEYQAKYDADRVRNTGSALLGATFGCAECHNHKFDPYTTKDFYSFAAFFADIQEKAVGRQDQTKLPTEEQLAEMGNLDAEIAPLRAVLDTPTPELALAQARWEESLKSRTIEWNLLKPSAATSAGGATLELLEDGTVQAKGKNPGKDTYTITIAPVPAGATALRLEVLPDDALPARGPGRADNGNFVLSELEIAVDGQKAAITRATASHSQKDYPVAHAIDGKAETGWAILPQAGKANHAVFETQANLAGQSLAVTLSFQYGTRHTLGRLRFSATCAVRPVEAEGADGLPADVAAALAVAPAERGEGQRAAIAAFYRSIAPELAGTRAEIAALEARKRAIEDAAPTSLISISGPPRTVRLLPRGNWLDDSGPIMEPAVPEFLGKLDTGDRRATRLDLAQWMVARDNPLVARVFVNRLWRLMFGQGLARNVDDLGTQGALPTHPELLDWLAVEFIDSGWDVKHIIRLMVTSRTYRQSSQTTPDIRQRDPANQWLARQGRFRADAEFIRDGALRASGLLATTIGGPSVKPYQPAGYWAHLNFPVREWKHDHGEAQYRRGLYTYWQRTFLHPSLLAFDASTREECMPERPRSNTPLQSLALLNDPTYVEAARVLAAKTLAEGGATEENRIRYAWRQVLTRQPEPAEQAVLSQIYQQHYAQYAADEAAAKGLLSVGEHPLPADVPPAELAAWTSVARTILNLHETITRD